MASSIKCISEGRPREVPGSNETGRLEAGAREVRAVIPMGWGLPTFESYATQNVRLVGGSRIIIKCKTAFPNPPFYWSMEKSEHETSHRLNFTPKGILGTFHFQKTNLTIDNQHPTIRYPCGWHTPPLASRTGL